MDLEQLWDIAATPDNVPIVALLPLVIFYSWLAWKQARANDALMEQLEADPALAKTHHRKTFPYRRAGRRKCTCGRSCCGWSFWRRSSLPSS